MGICSLKDFVKECNGRSEAVPGGECFLRGPPETEGKKDFLSSLSSSHTSQGPEPGSGHIFIWVWALKILVKTQIRNPGLLVPFEKKGNSIPSPSPKAWVSTPIQEWLVSLPCPRWGGGGGPSPARQQQTPPVPRLMRKSTQRHKTHQELNS